ncbi:MAG TPA: hypothetical protein VFJ91_02155 [Gaiellaceae bacterium]|nr:hypothetical protein [Gaiellaceae bacterium]
MGFLLRRRTREAPPIREAEAYERLHGDRSGEVFAVAAVERKPIPRRTGDLTGELLRRAFESKLDARAHD